MATPGGGDHRLGRGGRRRCACIVALIVQHHCSPSSACRQRGRQRAVQDRPRRADPARRRRDAALERVRPVRDVPAAGLGARRRDRRGAAERRGRRRRDRLLGGRAWSWARWRSWWCCDCGCSTASPARQHAASPGPPPQRTAPMPPDVRTCARRVRTDARPGRDRGRRRARRDRRCPDAPCCRRRRPGGGRGGHRRRRWPPTGTTWCSAPASPAASPRSASATSRSRRRSRFADLGRRDRRRVRARLATRLRRRRYDVAPALAVELADRTGGHLGTILTVATVTGTAASADRAARAATPTRWPRRWRAPGWPPRPRRHGVPFAEVRAISNVVGPRDRDAWHIPARASTALRAGRPRPSARRMDRREARLLAVPERHLRLPRLDARAASTAPRRSRSPSPTSTSPTPPPSAASSTSSRCPTPRCRGCSTRTRCCRAAARSAAAAGRSCSPAATLDSLDGRTVAVPSERSTAYLLFRLWAAGQRPARIDVVPFASDHAGGARRPRTTPGW